MASKEGFVGKYFVDVNFRRRKYAVIVLLITYLIFTMFTFLDMYLNLNYSITLIINNIKVIMGPFSLLVAGMILLLGQMDAYVNRDKIILKRGKKKVVTIHINEIESLQQANELGDFASLRDLFGFKETLLISLLLIVGAGVSIEMYKISPTITLVDLLGTVIICLLIYLGYQKIPGKIGVQVINAAIMGFIGFSFSFVYAFLNFQDILLGLLIITIVTLLAITVGWHLSSKAPFLCYTLMIKDERGNIIIFDAFSSSVLKKFYKELIEMVKVHEASRETGKGLGID